MSNDAVENAIQQEVESLYERLGYMSTLLSMVVQQAGGNIVVDPNIELGSVKGIRIDTLEDGNWELILDTE